MGRCCAGDLTDAAALMTAEESHHVTSFGTASDVVLISLVEVWAEDVGDASRTPRR